MSILLIFASCGKIPSVFNESIFQKIRISIIPPFELPDFNPIDFSLSSFSNKEPEQQKPITRNIIHQQEGVVEVVMKFSENGQWKVVNLSATNEELARYVLARLKEYHPQTQNKTNGQVVKYRFVFKQQT